MVLAVAAPVRFFFFFFFCTAIFVRVDSEPQRRFCRREASGRFIAVWD